MPVDYEKIRENNIREYGEGTKHLSFLSRMYADRTHFVFELLQNAEDAGASRILFRLFNDRLEVVHDGRVFNEQDVRGLCGIQEGTKVDDLTQIGKFGIGFKSVYAYTSTPKIHSGDECFRIENYVRPFAEQPEEIDNSSTTLFILPFNREGVAPEDACKEIGKRLRNLSARTLLFLRNIDEIEYSLPDSCGGTYLREEKRRGPARQVNVIGQNNGEYEEEYWLVFERPVEVSGKSHVRVEVGLRLEVAEKEGKSVERIVKIQESPLYVFFPTEKSTRFGFLVQGPYRTTPARDNIPKDDNWNEFLVEKTADLIRDILLEVKDLGLLSVSLLEALPIRAEDFPDDSMFYPIVKSVRNTLIKEELLPTDDGSFVSAGNAKLARGAELRKLLSNSQLQRLFQSTEKTKWLVDEITYDRTRELRDFLVDELRVDEVDPDKFSRILTEHFLSEQSDEWIVAFYRYVETVKTLWKRTLRNPWQPVPILHSKPIIRLNDGTQVNPFGGNGKPNAYLSDGTSDVRSVPIVKVAISEDKEACDFLKELGIPDFDRVEEVLSRILPRYECGDWPDTIDEHMRDIGEILQANATDSHGKKERLQSKLVNTAFVRVECQDGNEVVQYKKPGEVYFKNEDLLEYFAGDTAGLFVCSQYSEEVRHLLENLGTAHAVRIKRRDKDQQGFVKIVDWHGNHKRGVGGFDPNIEVEGLTGTLASITLEKSQFIWKEIAIPNADCIRGTVEFSTRQTFENSEKEEIVSDFGKSLADAEWLPHSDGSFCKPCDLALTDLPESFLKDERLARQLGMKLDNVAKLAEEVGVSKEDIDIIRDNPEEFLKFKETLSVRKAHPLFPSARVTDQERRHASLVEILSEAPLKEHESKERIVRTTSSSIDPETWLRNHYTNAADQMVCQICKEEMPFHKRDGTYYFERREILSNKHLPKELEAQYLALCPVCAAKYQEYVQNDDGAMEELKRAIIEADISDGADDEVPITLCGEKETIKFVQVHIHDLQAILRESRT